VGWGGGGAGRGRRDPRALGALAQKHSLHLFGPLILDEAGKCFNATVGFAPSGEHVVTYRKRHPWIPEEWATAGREPYPLFEIAGFRVTIACCYDVHFLADEATEVLDAADLLLFPSAWVEEVDSRPRRLRALARRHRVAVAGANWGKGELWVAGQGGSCIIDARGEVLAKTKTSGTRADATLSRPG
jgi:predicted amidohydrolase